MLFPVYPDKILTVIAFDRFHLRSQFDGRKRSCRKSLADHNRRRRKPQASPCTASECEAATTYLEDGKQKTNGSSAHEATG